MAYFIRIWWNRIRTSFSCEKWQWILRMWMVCRKTPTCHHMGHCVIALLTLSYELFNLEWHYTLIHTCRDNMADFCRRRLQFHFIKITYAIVTQIKTRAMSETSKNPRRPWDRYTAPNSKCIGAEHHHPPPPPPPPPPHHHHHPPPHHHHHHHPTTTTTPSPTTTTPPPTPPHHHPYLPPPPPTPTPTPSPKLSNSSSHTQ